MFIIDFDIDFIVKVNVLGVQGFFCVVDVDISVQMYYMYDVFEVLELVLLVVDVSVLFIGSVCVVIFGFVLYCCKKVKNVC